MKIAVWKTGHQIADTLAYTIHRCAILAGRNAEMLMTANLSRVREYDVHIGYGILRGMGDVFRECDKHGKPWLHLDRGYFKPGHFDGYYRVSLRGTQQTEGLHRIAPDYGRLERLGIELKPWRGFDRSNPVLVCPPTQPVMDFFGCYIWQPKYEKSAVIRHKGDTSPINFNDYSHVVTFNSSVGWQALSAGIPCISEPDYSIVGSWFKKTLIDDLSERQYAERQKLFAVMSTLQLTLEEIRAGALWELMDSLLSLSDTTAENPLHPTLPLIASGAKPQEKLIYAI